jgi:hypothetical protein
MAPKIKNIIIFVIVAAVFILIYIFFIKPSPDQASLISSSSTSLPDVNGSGANTNIPNGNSLVSQDFLTLLLNVKNIKLNDAILSDPAFNSLRDSSIVLTPDGTEGRLNPFAQFGSDSITAPINNTLNTITP